MNKNLQKYQFSDGTKLIKTSDIMEIVYKKSKKSRHISKQD